MNTEQKSRNISTYRRFSFQNKQSSPVEREKVSKDVGVIYESIQYQFNPSRPNPGRSEK